MIASFLNILKVPDLRRKVAITIGLCIVDRIGAHVPVPFINPAKLTEFIDTMRGSGAGSGLVDAVDLFSGGAFAKMTIFALGIMPYISASIVLQLLQVIWPRIEKIAKEGEAGRKKINQWTRYGTVLLSLFQGLGTALWLVGNGLAIPEINPYVVYLTTAMTLAAGTCFVMWLGEKITEHGIGNGISIIIAIGIIARYPYDIRDGYLGVTNGGITWLAFIGVLLAMVVFAGLTVINQQANRKIPVQHARRMVGRNVMQGGNTFLPLKLNTAGVIPVIFSSAMLTFPQFLIQFLPRSWAGPVGDFLSPSWYVNPYDMMGLNAGGIFLLLKVVNFWTVAYILLTLFFCYFYTALTFNPVDLADNLKKSGAFIPGRKPGKQTSDYINHILVRITIVGALFLIVIALVPDVLSVSFKIPYQFASIAGGTGLIIVVGVMLDTMKQIESQLLMRHYDGFTLGGGATAGGRRRRRL